MEAVAPDPVAHLRGAPVPHRPDAAAASPPRSEPAPAPPAPVVPFDPARFRWEGVPEREYKFQEGTGAGLGWRDVVRCTLLRGAPELAAFSVRYFEVAPGGYTSLERHRHVHAVVVVRGRGRVVLGHRVYPLRPLDFVYVPPDTPHQFVCEGEEPFGFLCVVDAERDAPQPLAPHQVEAILADAEARRWARP